MRVQLTVQDVQKMVKVLGRDFRNDRPVFVSEAEDVVSWYYIVQDDLITMSYDRRSTKTSYEKDALPRSLK